MMNRILFIFQNLNTKVIANNKRSIRPRILDTKIILKDFCFRETAKYNDKNPPPTNTSANTEPMLIENHVCPVKRNVRESRNKIKNPVMSDQLILLRKNRIYFFFSNPFSTLNIV